MKRTLLLWAISACLYTSTVLAQSNPDPRILATLTLPQDRLCTSAVSDNGQQIFTICDRNMLADETTPAGPAKLYVHNISDLTSPQQDSVTEIGTIAGWKLLARNNLLAYQHIFGKGITLINTSTPFKPKVAGHINSGYSQGFRLASNASVLATGTDAQNPTYYSLANPAAPRLISATAAAELIQDPSITHFGNGNLLDTRSGQALVTEAGNPLLLHLYNLISPTPQRVATITGPDYHSAHIIPTRNAILLEVHPDKNTYRLYILKAEDTAFNAASLKALHNQFLPQFAPCLNPSPTVPTTCYALFKQVAALRDAGIETLLTTQPQGITSAERIHMLNNYGYWISLPGFSYDSANLRKSATILETVVQLAPQRSSAWLNLADTYRALIPHASTDTEKADLWQKASSAYTRYQQLSGKPATGAAALATFNLPQALRTAHNVCDYIAQAHNTDSIKLITSEEGQAKRGKKHISFTVGWAGGSCATQQIRAKDCDWMSCFDNEEQLAGFSFADGGWGGDVIIVPFKGTFYTAQTGPGAVINPVSGKICTLKASFKPHLAENTNPALCEKFMHGKLTQALPFTPLADKEIEPANTDIARGYAHFGQAVSTSFNGSSTVRVGHFSIASGAGCGCDHNGIALISGSTIISTTTQPNASLLEAQDKWWSCGNADARLVTENGTIYVEAWGDDAKPLNQRPRVLLQLKGDTFQPVCRIEQVRTISSHK